MVTVPDSIFDKSRMSLIEVQQVGAGTVNGPLAYSTCLGREVAFARFPTIAGPRMRMLLSGVRNSWDMFGQEL